MGLFGKIFRKIFSFGKKVVNKVGSIGKKAVNIIKNVSGVGGNLLTGLGTGLAFVAPEFGVPMLAAGAAAKSVNGALGGSG
jgi:hypothetical protein